MRSGSPKRARTSASVDRPSSSSLMFWGSQPGSESMPITATATPRRRETRFIGGVPGKSRASRGYQTMSFFRRPHYRSDATNFINDLKKQKPELPSQQLARRPLRWDRDVTHEGGKARRAGRVDQKPYVYQTTS